MEHCVGLGDDETEYIDSKPIQLKMPLGDIQPRSLTLLHDIFHALHSGNFHFGDDEDCKYAMAPWPLQRCSSLLAYNNLHT